MASVWTVASVWSTPASVKRSKCVDRAKPVRIVASDSDRSMYLNSDEEMWIVPCVQTVASVVHNCKCVDSAGPVWTVAKVGADTQRYVTKFYNYSTKQHVSKQYVTQR
jgi:hypothetical protein